MADQKIEAGYIVKLRSGGPEMTVEWIDHERNEAYCVWFVKGDQKGQKFAITSLVILQ